MKASDTVLLSAAVVFFALLTVGALVARHMATTGNARSEHPSAVAVDTAAAHDPGLGAFYADSVRPAIPPQQEP